MRVFFDTSAFYALISKTDKFHKEAKGRYEEILSKNCILYTSNYVLLETIALVQYRLGKEILLKVIPPIVENFEIFWIDEKLHKQIWEVF